MDLTQGIDKEIQRQYNFDRKKQTTKMPEPKELDVQERNSHLLDLDKVLNYNSNKYVDKEPEHHDIKVFNTHPNRSKSSTDHTSKKLRRNILFEEKQQIIDRENQRMIEKMTKILTEKSTIGKMLEQPIKKDKTLNRLQRKRQLFDIVEQNKLLLDRIQRQKSEYSNNKFMKLRETEEKLLNFLCKHPLNRAIESSHLQFEEVKDESKRDNIHVLSKKSENRKSSVPTPKSNHPYSSDISREVSRDDNKTPRLSKSPFVANEATGKESRTGFHAGAVNNKVFDENRTILYKKSRLLDNSIYLIEISKAKAYYMINAYHMEGSETYCLELTKLRMQELLEQCDNDYNILVSKLKIFRGKLLLRVYNGSRVSPISSGARTPIQTNGIQTDKQQIGSDSLLKMPPIKPLSITRSKSAIRGSKYNASSKLFIEKVTNTDISSRFDEIMQKHSPYSLQIPENGIRASFKFVREKRFKPAVLSSNTSDVHNLSERTYT